MPPLKASNKIVREMCKKHPDAPSRTIARLLHEKYPHEWESVEAARNDVRRVRGNNGPQARRVTQDKSLYRPNGEHCTIHVPDGLKQTKDPKHFHDAGKWLIIGDLHIPYHDARAVREAVTYGLDHGCKHLLINGDYYDFYQLSEYDRDPSKRDPEREMKVGRPILQQLAEKFTGRKVFKVGNHEDRYERYLAKRAGAVLGIKAFRLDRVLGLKKLGFEYVASKQFYKIGKLSGFHGHELPKGLTNPVNIGRGVFMRVDESAFVNHWHRTSTHIETSGLKTRTITCYSLGCLCDLFPEYAPVNKWNHGFAVLDVAEEGTWNMMNRTIVNGTVYETE